MMTSLPIPQTPLGKYWPWQPNVWSVTALDFSVTFEEEIKDRLKKFCNLVKLILTFRFKSNDLLWRPSLTFVKRAIVGWPLIITRQFNPNNMWSKKMQSGWLSTRRIFTRPVIAWLSDNAILVVRAVKRYWFFHHLIGQLNVAFSLSRCYWFQRLKNEKNNIGRPHENRVF